MIHIALPAFTVLVAGHGPLTLGLLMLIDALALLALGVHAAGRKHLGFLLDGDYWLRRARRRHSRARLLLGVGSCRR
jgi:hypothetical protein